MADEMIPQMDYYHTYWYLKQTHMDYLSAYLNGLVQHFNSTFVPEH
jgi:hypothetical protein